MDLLAAVSEIVTEAVGRVFSTMVPIEVTLQQIVDVTADPPEVLSEVTGTVHLVGKINGIICLSIHPLLCRELTIKILRGTGILTERDENDVVGELTNMITGNLKTAMADLGYNSALSVPSVLRGKEIKLSCKGYAVALEFTFAVPSLNETFQVRAMAKLE